MAGAKGVRISEFDLPEDSVRPGKTVTARIDATNTSNFINPWDKDKCNDGNVGLLVEGVVVAPNGQEHVGESVCAPQHDIVQSYEVTSDVSFEVPESEGVYQYDAFIRTVETQHESSRLTGQVEVFSEDSDGTTEADDDGTDGSSPWSRPNGGEEGSSTLPFGGDNTSRMEVALLLVVVLGGFYAAGQLFDIQIGGGA